MKKNAYVSIQARDAKEVYRVSFADLYNSFEVNYQLNANYEVSFTLTYTKQYADVFNACKPKAWVYFENEFYVVQQAETAIDEHGLLTVKVTASHILLDKMRNVRIDPPEPTEDNPDVSGSGQDSATPDKQPGVVIKKTEEKKYYPLNDRLDQFFKNNDQGIKYELHGNFPQVAVDCSGSLFEWLGQHIKDFGAYYLPVGNTLQIYDMPSLEHETGQQFRYLHNIAENNVQINPKDIVNDCMVYGGKMEKDITTVSGGGGSGAGGNLDDVEGFCKSSIGADFGVNKDAMLQNFAARSDRVKAWGVDVNRLYDTIKGQGISPEWFMAYELQEQGSGWGWLNHTYKHGDAYQDAISVCNWIKQTANSATLVAATESGKGDQSMAAKWNVEFPKGTIGRVYLQGTAAAAWELEGIAGGYYGKPLAGCVNVIKSWGGHTNQGAASTPNGNDAGTWGWPFPSTGEGHFMGAQLFGKNPGGEFRPNGFHDGLDFGSIDHPGNEVHAIHGGKVTVGPAWASGGIGWYVAITDSTGLSVEYQEAFSNSALIHVHVGDIVHTGDVIGIRDGDHVHIGITRHGFPEAFSHAFSNDGTWLNPLEMIKSGASAGTPSGNSSGSTPTYDTTKQGYYSLSFHYENQDSINRYGRYKGPNIVMGSIYDMDTLKKYADATVQHDPPTSITMKNVMGDDFKLGDKVLAVVPEMNINYSVTLIGMKGNPFKDDRTDFELTFNNTGLAMKNVINAIYNDIRGMNPNFNQVNIVGSFGGRDEDRLDNITVDRGNVQLSQDDLNAIKKFTDS